MGVCVWWGGGGRGGGGEGEGEGGSLVSLLAVYRSQLQRPTVPGEIQAIKLQVKSLIDCS